MFVVTAFDKCGIFCFSLILSIFFIGECTQGGEEYFRFVYNTS